MGSRLDLPAERRIEAEGEAFGQRLQALPAAAQLAEGGGEIVPGRAASGKGLDRLLVDSERLLVALRHLEGGAVEGERVMAGAGRGREGGADRQRLRNAAGVEKRISVVDDVRIHALRLKIVIPDLIRGP